MNACPRCKGKTGYEFWIRERLQGEWGDEAQTVGDVIGPSSVKCIDCGYRVDRWTAAGEPREAKT